MQDITSGYSDEPQPLRAYATLTALYGAVVAGASILARRSGRQLSENLSARDISLLAVATYKLSRLLSRDWVTSFLRAPFAEYQERAGHGELEEKARGRGLRLATGELIICPYCLGQWVAGGFALGLVGAPRVTRLVAAMYAAETISDGLHLAYHAASERS